MPVTPLVGTKTAVESLAFPAVQLFVERVAANIEEFGLTDDTASVVADICRRLGIAPTALSAARVHLQKADLIAFLNSL